GVAGVLGGAGIAVVADLTLSRGEDALAVDAGVPGAAVVVVAGGADADAAAILVALVVGGTGVAVVTRGARGRRGDALTVDAGVPGAGVLVVAVDGGPGALAVGVALVLGSAGIPVVAGLTRGRREDALPFDAGVLGTGVLVVADNRLAGADAVGIAGVLGGAG